MNILSKLKSKAKKRLMRIAFAEGHDERVLQAINILKKEKICIPVLLGDHIEIENKAKELGIGLIGTEIIVCNDPLTHASTLLLDTKVDGVVAGATHKSKDTIKAALEIPHDFCMSYFLMVRKNESSIFADCSFNINPDAEELAKIAIMANDEAKRLGLDPKVALLSFSTKEDRDQKIIDALNIVKSKRKDIVIDGELQFDAAFIKEIAVAKDPNGILKGDANVFIFPDLNSGNIGYKIAERLGNFEAIGPIILGLKKPYNDLSRGCSAKDIVSVAIITVVQAQENS